MISLYIEKFHSHCSHQRTVWNTISPMLDLHLMGGSVPAHQITSVGEEIMKRAFTLIELLVVIAIIAILAAILFPVFAQAKAAAKKISALSNMKQIGTATQIYLADVDDMMPMGSGGCWWQPRDGGWTQDTRPYIKNFPILRDASDTLSKAGWPSWLQTHPDGLNISFVANGIIRWDGSRNSLFGLMGMIQGNSGDPACGRWMGRDTTNATAVSLPADTIMYSTRYGSQVVWGPGTFVAGVDWWDWTGHGGIIPDGGAANTPYSANGVLVNRNRQFGSASVGPHGEKANFVFADSHAKTLDPRATNPNEAARPLDNMWNAYR
jgi:prepilin-type N-terminal cleavage/methylation domain-containing protein/prepilin-type processing-associated H-X9-DG protein